MDEEDGRPGALAKQAGQTDALTDALPLSLRHQIPPRHDPSTYSSGCSTSLFFRCGINFPRAVSGAREDLNKGEVV
jgi:hypothetical protein